MGTPDLCRGAGCHNRSRGNCQSRGETCCHRRCPQSTAWALMSAQAHTDSCCAGEYVVLLAEEGIPDEATRCAGMASTSTAGVCTCMDLSTSKMRLQVLQSVFRPSLPSCASAMRILHRVTWLRLHAGALLSSIQCCLPPVYAHQ